MDLPFVLAQPREAVLAEMRAALGDRSLPIYAMARYALGWVEADGGPRTDPAGKGIRPALAVLAGRAVDPSDAAGRRALAGAAAVEFVHNFSLVHDRHPGPRRRASPSPHRLARLGGGAGDQRRRRPARVGAVALSRAVQAGASPATVLAAGDTLNRCTLEMIEGHYLDLDYETRPAVSADDYLTMVERKTGALLGSSLALGGSAGRRRSRGRRPAGRGRPLPGSGLPDPRRRAGHLGRQQRPPASRRTTTSGGRKKSFPIVYALDQTDAPEHAALERVYGRDAGADGLPVGDEDVRGVHAGARRAGGAGGVGAGGRHALRRLPRGARRLRPARGGPGGAGGGGAVHRAAGALRHPP